MISSAKVTQLREQTMIGGREGIRNFAGQQPGFPTLGSRFATSSTVQANAQGQGALPMLNAKLGDGPSKDSRQHVTGATLGHSRISRGIHKSKTVGRSQDRMKALQDDVRPPGFGCL